MYYYRYVKYEDISAYEAIGWRQVNDLRPCRHDAWSTIMKWGGEGDPRDPEKSNEAEA